ncbi:MAG: phage holin family protein [Pseudonocardiaceae bacterium]
MTAAYGTSNDASFKDLWSTFTSEAGTLVRKEADLAKVEVKGSVVTAGKAGAMFGGMGVLGFLALQALTVAAGLGLATVLPSGVAFLIVGFAYFVVAGLLFAIGKKYLRGLKPPEKVIDTVKQDIKTAKTAFMSGMNTPEHEQAPWNHSLTASGTRRRL